MECYTLNQKQRVPHKAEQIRRQIMKMLEERTAIVLGASSGVGYGAALRFAEEGAHVIAGARSLNKLEVLKAEAEKRGFSGTVTPVACDVTNDDDLDRILRVCLDAYGKVDILACIAQSNLNDQHGFEDSDLENVMAFYRGGPGYTFQMIKKGRPRLHIPDD